MSRGGDGEGGECRRDGDRQWTSIECDKEREIHKGGGWVVIRGKKLIAAFPMRFVESSVGQIGRGGGIRGCRV